MSYFTVTYRVGHDGPSRVTTIWRAEIAPEHDTLARIIAVYLTGDPETRHVLTIDQVEVTP